MNNMPRTSDRPTLLAASVMLDETSDPQNLVAASMAHQIYSKPWLRSEEKQPEQCDAPQPSTVLPGNVIPIPSGVVIAERSDLL